MMNIIRADIYAILRGKALYITFGLIFLLVSLVVGAQAANGVNIGINLASIDEVGVVMPDIEFDGMRSVTLLYTQMNNMIWFLLPLILVASAPTFTHGTIKNDIAWGVSRAKLYFAKLIIAIGLCVLMVLFYMGVGMALATALFGWGGAASDGFWLNVFQTLSAQTFMLIALTCIGIFCVFTFRRTSIVNGIYIAFCLVPTMVILLLVDVNPNVARLLDFDVMLGISRLGFLSQLETSAILTTLGVGVFYIFAATIGGIALFKRTELK